MNDFRRKTGLVPHTGIRGRNVPARFRNVEVLYSAPNHLPSGFGTATAHSDAVERHGKLLKYGNAPMKRPAANCAVRFGMIDFAIGNINYL